MELPGWARSETVAASLISVGPVTCDCTGLAGGDIAVLACT